LWVCAALAVTASSALGMHVFNPPWVTNPTDPQWQGGSTTSQSWEYAIGASSLTQPAHVNNPFGTPQVNWQGSTPQFDPNGPGYTGVWTWHVDVDGGGFMLDIPNDPIERPRKVIHLQYTSDKAGSVPTTNPPGTAAAGGVAGHANAYYTYEWTLEIRPNPQSEQIWVTFPASANIEEIHVATICVPEPTTLALLGVGTLAVIRRRR
jgi:hypothetical protein